MRLLWQIVGVLVMANLLVLWWPAQGGGADSAYQRQQEVNPRYVRLNKEIEDRHSQQQVKAQHRQLNNTHPQQANTQASIACYRLGPFLEAENFESAQTKLLDAKVSHTKSTRQSQESNVWRVYIGPYSSFASATDARTKLRSINIADHFVRKEAEGRFVVSLGIYTSQDTANKGVALLQDKVQQVKLKQERLVLPKNYWLYFALSQNSPKLKKLNLIDWREPAAKVGLFDCQN